MIIQFSFVSFPENRHRTQPSFPLFSFPPQWNLILGENLLFRWKAPTRSEFREIRRGSARARSRVRSGCMTPSLSSHCSRKSVLATQSRDKINRTMADDDDDTNQNQCDRRKRSFYSNPKKWREWYRSKIRKKIIRRGDKNSFNLKPSEAFNKIIKLT